MSKDFDQYESAAFAQMFNYFDEVLPAKTNFFVEAAMVTKLMRSNSRMSLKQAQQSVHNIVHIAEHFTVVNG